MKKIVRITTVPGSLKSLLKGQLSYMQNYYQIIGVSSSGKQLEEVQIREGISTNVVEMTRTISPLKDLKSTYKLYKLLKKEKPFIVHTHTPKAGTLGMLAARLARVPNRLHTIAGLPLLEAKGFKRLILNLVEKITYANATLILPNSFGLMKIIIDHNFTNTNKLKVIANGSSNGIDTDNFHKSNISLATIKSLKSELNIKEGDFTFIFLGRLVADKGINELISAFNKISAENKNIKLLLVGLFEKELDPLNKKTIESIETNKQIIRVGWQNDVRPYLAISSALVFPSYREGFPNVVLQACAMELPAVVTNINGCNEIITHNVNGIIVEPKDENALYKAMIELLNNNSLRDRFAEVTRKNIEDKYKREVVWKEMLELYKSLEKN